MRSMMSRESMEFDVVIVGAGPAGLSTAIHLAQLAQQKNRPLTIAVLEKGATIGAHLLSGAVLEPGALNELIPNWQNIAQINKAPVTTDQFYWLTKKHALRLPKLKQMSNQGNFIISLGELCQFLSQEAEKLGVSIFPGFAAHQVLFDENNSVIGVQTGDFGLNKQRQPTDRYQPGINLLAKQTVFAEGCRGSLSELLIKKFNLRAVDKPQTYGIGIKEIWRVKSALHQPGKVIHTVGWPLQSDTYGGSFVYHLKNNLVAVGMVIGLDYPNPYLDPFQELQRFKTHPMIKPLLENGECLRYGARALNEGGFQATPQLTFPGGLLVGCAAGFVNIAKIKGIHNAIRSGMLAAKTIIDAPVLTAQLSNYQMAVEQSPIYQELYQVRNIRPAFHTGLLPGLLYSGIDQYLLRGKAPWTFSNHLDNLSLKPAVQCEPIVYPKADGKITFDKLTQVYLTATQHREDEPCHLLVRDPIIPIEVNWKIYAGPEQRYCPAGVYEFVNANGTPRLQINAANCIHCKTCDIKDPRQNIQWTTPEGGDGPNYQNM